VQFINREILLVPAFADSDFLMLSNFGKLVRQARKRLRFARARNLYVFENAIFTCNLAKMVFTYGLTSFAMDSPRFDPVISLLS
jgi:hypothetical protein